MEWLDEKKKTSLECIFDVSQTSISGRLRKWGVSNSDGIGLINIAGH
jgi:hypothetical protein